MSNGARRKVTTTHAQKRGQDAPADVSHLLEWLIANGVERGIGFPACTELEESFRLTLEKADFVEDAPAERPTR